MFFNWPVRKTPLSYVSGVDISPQGKYLAVGNAKGRVLLYRQGDNSCVYTTTLIWIQSTSSLAIHHLKWIEFNHVYTQGESRLRG